MGWSPPARVVLSRPVWCMEDVSLPRAWLVGRCSQQCSAATIEWRASCSCSGFKEAKELVVSPRWWH